MLTFSFTCANPHLLVTKTILNEHVVEGKDLTIQYSLYNIGSSTAQSVMLSDDTFLPEEFENKQGLMTVKWDRINANANVTHTVVLRPLAAGFFNMSWASINYQSPESKSIQGYSSAPGVVQVISYDVFSRKYEAHLVDWLAFVAMSAPTILLPLFLWYRSHSKYENLKLKKA